MSVVRKTLEFCPQQFAYMYKARQTYVVSGHVLTEMICVLLQGVFVMVTVGGDKGCGQFLVAGKENDVTTLGPK